MKRKPHRVCQHAGCAETFPIGHIAPGGYEGVYCPEHRADEATDGPLCDRCDGDGWIETWSTDGWVETWSTDGWVAGAADCPDCLGSGRFQE